MVCQSEHKLRTASEKSSGELLANSARNENTRRRWSHVTEHPTDMNSFTSKALLNKLRQQKPKNSGFTLIELLIVVVIIGILSGIALPNFLSQRNKAKVAAANAAAAALISACEIAITNDATLPGAADATSTTDDVARLWGSIPSEAEAAVTPTITPAVAAATGVAAVPASCSATVTGTSVATDGAFTTFGAKTSAIAS